MKEKKRASDERKEGKKTEKEEYEGKPKSTSIGRNKNKERIDGGRERGKVRQEEKGWMKINLYMKEKKLWGSTFLI